MKISFAPHAFSWLLLLALASPVALCAQQAPAATPASTVVAPSNTSRALVYRAAPPEQRADKMSQEISRELSLDAATTAKVRAVALARCQKIDAIQNGTDTNKVKSKALEANAQDFKTALQGVLTPAQYTQYLSHSGKHSSPKASTSTATPAPAN